MAEKIKNAMAAMEAAERKEADTKHRRGRGRGSAGNHSAFDPEKNKKMIELYDRYRRGEINRNDVFDVLWPILIPQIETQMGQFSRRLNADEEDLKQEAAAAVLEHIDDYDPYKSVPGSYFLNWINEAHRNLCRGEKSIYYLNIIKKLSSVAQEAGFEGIADRSLSDVALASLSGESIQVVKRARYMDFIYTPVDYEGVEDTVEDPYHSSPEKIFFQTDREEKGFEAFFKELDKFEQMLYYSHAAKGESFKEISLILKTNDLFLKLGFKSCPTSSELQRRYAVCDRKLAGNRAVAEERRHNSHETADAEQASISDLMSLMARADFDDDDIEDV